MNELEAGTLEKKTKNTPNVEKFSPYLQKS